MIIQYPPSSSVISNTVSVPNSLYELPFMLSTLRCCFPRRGQITVKHIQMTEAVTEAVEASLAVRKALCEENSLHECAATGDEIDEASCANTSRRLKSCLPRSWCLPRDENALAALCLGPGADSGGDDASSKPRRGTHLVPW